MHGSVGPHRSKLEIQELAEIMGGALAIAGIGKADHTPAPTQPAETEKGYRFRKPRDFPVFDGNPMEWPLFISQFNMTTEHDKKCLKGKAKEAVKDYLLVPEDVPNAIEVLRKFYGTPEMVIETVIEKLKKFPPVKENRFDQLIELSHAVRNAVSNMKTLKCPGHLTNPSVVKELMGKLPANMQLMWCRERRKSPDPTLETFAEWLTEAAEDASYANSWKTSATETLQEKKGGSRTSRALPAASEGDKKCFCCNKAYHHLEKCPEFQKLDGSQIWSLIRGKQVCYNCYIKGHLSSECKSGKTCGKNGCTKSHHYSLHDYFESLWKNRRRPSSTKRELPKKSDGAKSEDTTTVHMESSSMDDTILSVVPVTVIGQSGELHTYALLDSGAKHTFIDSAVSKRIGVTGPKKSMRVLGFGELSSVDHDARRVKIPIRGPSKETFELVNVVSMKDLLLPVQSVSIKDMKKRFQYLKHVPLCSMNNAKPTILIGQDNFGLMAHQRIVEGKIGEPAATLTRLGWVLQGGVSSVARASDFGVVLLAHEKERDSLHQLVMESFQTETFGVKLVQEPKRSIADTRALKIMEESTTQKGFITEPTDAWMSVLDTVETIEYQTGRWETGLPWKQDGMELPESKSVAMRRLKCIEKKMDSNSVFGQEYCEKIQAYLDKGFARKLSEEEAKKEGPRTWYLPHFDVHNPNKPGKWRLVFDAAAKCHGASLNDVLIQGPDLLNPLPMVLFKFRQKKIAFTADIKDFFHRILIHPDDLCAQRFLWRGMDRSRPPDTMEMKVMVFGAVSFPFCAQYVRNRNAERFAKDYPEAVDGIVKKHYIDDYLDCADTVEDTLKLINDVVMIHRKGGFQIVGWTCSSREVLAELPEALKSDGQKELEPDSELPMARVLGLQWDPNKDAFTFKCKFNKVNEEIVGGVKIPTKREMLKLVMSVFDPLGFLCHFTIKAKILLQEVWRSDIGWDEEVSATLFSKWCSWLEELKGIPLMKIPRCYSGRVKDAHSVQLHVFCDASDKAFAAVGYFRVDTGDAVDVSFVMGRTRVAPLKSISIPRLELQAAVMASRLSVTIQESHDIQVGECHFWTDNRAVLCWLRAESRNFKPFIAHRVGEIQEATEVAKWHWVPLSTRWVNGPDFLKLTQNEWPKEREKIVDSEFGDSILEKKQEAACLVATVKEDSLPDISRFSSWLKLVRSTAWMLRFIRKCGKGAPTSSLCWEQWRAPVIQCLGGRELRRSPKPQPSNILREELCALEVLEAEHLWWKKAQWDSFPEEMSLLSDGKPLPRSSRLVGLSPYMNHGVMRLRGRTDLGSLLLATKHPVILDPKHPFTKLLIQHYHEKARHQGQETVVNELRQQYWIIGMRNAVRSAWNSCLVCKIRRAKPISPEMGQLPKFRLEKSFRPFITTGVDYFGPMEVTIGRRHEKRYGALFTCLTTRAVHLEIAASPNTDSAIMAVRRFVARRGCPTKMYSDNGTNFVGAANEIEKALQEIDWAKVETTFGPEGMEWSFIPPSAPHMGGTWERLVRSVKTALGVTLKERAPREEVLQTLFAEAENIVNSRPLTHVSVDADDEESLTSNHFLIGSSNGVHSPGVFTDTDLCLRKQWRIAQRLADHFWSRWVKEYLPTLTKRTKWFEKSESLKIGDLVLIADGDLPRNHWPRGRIVKTFPGKDGQVRVAEVQTQTGLLKRPVVKLCVLDVEPRDIGSSEGVEDRSRGQSGQLEDC